jgi:hypothetical protein
VSPDLRGRSSERAPESAVVGPQRAETGGERDVGARQVSLVEELLGEAGPAGPGKPGRTDAELADEEPVEMSWRNGEHPGHPFDARIVGEAARDEPEGPPDEIGPDIPVR